jgi:hypothetical protein
VPVYTRKEKSLAALWQLPVDASDPVRNTLGSSFCTLGVVMPEVPGQGCKPLHGAARQPHHARRCVACQARSRRTAQTAQSICHKLAGAAAATIVSLGLAVGDPEASAARARLGADEQKSVDLFLKNTSSVVNVTSLSSRRDTFTSDMQDYPQGAGSGIVWDTQGHVVVRARCYSGVAWPD